MNLNDLKTLVKRRSDLFRGFVTVTEADLQNAEAQLSHRLPNSLRWLLTECGYSEVCGLDSLGDAVAATVRCRKTIGLPKDIVVLNDWNDAGVVYLDYGQTNPSGDVPVFWVGAHNFSRLADGASLDKDVDRHPNYETWVGSRVDAHDEGGL